jgi:restriction endonuclease S subunit
MKPKSEQPDSGGEETLHLSIPALQEQQKIAAKLDSLFVYANKLQKAGKLTAITQDKFKSYVLDKVFTSKLPDSFYDEPDSIILERFIKEQDNSSVDPLE